VSLNPYDLESDLVTACENDLDAERMKRREVEAELKSAKHLNAKWMDERTTALMDKEKAEAALAEVLEPKPFPRCPNKDCAEWASLTAKNRDGWDERARKAEAALATRTANRDELVEMVRSLKAALAERDGMLMVLFMEERDEQVDRGQDFFMPSDIWLADLKARAEEAKP